MTIRDQGPQKNLGFGLTSRDVPQQGEEQGVDPKGSFIARSLADDPIFRFFAVGAATMVGMHVAGSMLKKGGLKLTKSALESPASVIPKNVRTTLVNDFRNIRNTLDDWEGVTRVDDLNNPESLFGSTVISKTGFAYRKGDQGAEWSMRNEVQQRLVRQARRLPYELPAAYVAQKLPGVGTDSIFGSDQERPDWSNPADVLADFAKTSAFNLAGYLLPFEAGGAAVKQGWRRIVNYGDGVANPQVQRLTADLGMSLNLVGHRASDLLAETARRSQRSSSAFAAGIDHAVRHTKPLPFHLKDVYQSARAKTVKETAKNIKAEDVFGIGVRMAHEGLRRVGRPIFSGQYFQEGYRARTKSFDDEWLHLEAIRAGKRPGIDTLDGTETLVDAAKASNIQRLSAVEQIADNVIHYGGQRANRPSIPSLKTGQFYSDQMDDRYKRTLMDTIAEHDLVRQGNIPKEDIAAYVRSLSVRQRPRRGARNDQLPLADRFGYDKVKGGSDPEFFRNLGEATSHMSHGKVLSKAFGDSITDADSTFLNKIPEFEAEVQDSWNAIYAEGIVPFASEKLGQSRIPFENFEDLGNGDTLQFLVRNTAARINQSARQQHGKSVIPLKREFAGGEVRTPFDDLRAHIGRFGFGTDNPQQMRDYLVEQGVISRPGTSGGFNIFGMRKLSVEDAMSNGYFGADPQRAFAIRQLTQQMSDFSETGAVERLRRTPVGDVIETRSGKIIDLSPLTNSFRKTIDSFADNFQIPFIGIKPLQTFGYGAERQTAETPVFQILGGETRQPFSGAKEKGQGWLFTRTKRSRGELQQLVDDNGLPRLRKVAGEFRSWDTDPHSMLGRHARLAIRDKGQGTSEERNWFKRAFNVDEDQPQSLGRLYNRFKNRKTDINNPAVLSKFILDYGGNVDEIATAAGLQGPAGRTAVANAFENLENHLRQFRLQPDVVKNLIDTDDPQLRKILEFEDRTTETMRGLHTLGGGGDVLSVMRSLGVEVGDEVDEATQLKLQQAFNAYLKPHIRGSRAPGYFDAQSSKKLRQRGIHRRIEEARADVGRFLAVSEGLKGGDFQNIAQRLLSNIDEMKSAGQISGTDYAEARAAVLGLQINFHKISQFEQGQNSQARVLDVMRSATATMQAKSILRDVADSKTEGGALGFAGRAIKKRYGVSEYEYPGSEYNPFSADQDSVFVPTFGTAYKRTGYRAVGSVGQVNNWSDPEAFSGMSVPGAHMFQRLNSFMSIGGLQLDETAYRGGLDFYARGLVGQRVLPAVAAGTAVLAIDRTAGGLVNERDEEGNRVYSPLVLGAGAKLIARGQVNLAGAIPGGQTKAEKEEEMFSGEVAIKKGRWWPLGSTPWEGGRVSYYRPSWYRRFTSGAGFTPEAGFDSPLEKLAFGHDFSPLRPLDPYRFERQTEDTRPYPVSGQYFNGPWGPLTSALNMTVGRVLKPEREMHKDQVEYYLSQAQLVGAGGVAPNQEIGTPLMAVGSGGRGARTTGRGSTPSGAVNYGDGSVSYGNGLMRDAETGATRRSGPSMGGESGIRDDARTTLSMLNEAYSDAALDYTGTNSAYGLTTAPGAFPPQIIPGGEPLSPNSLRYQAGQFGYQLQELAGIYGFTFGAVRSSLGMGDQDYNPKRPVLESSTGATSMGRAFWENNFGGMGDMPLPLEGDYANLELSEFVRRFVTRERAGVNEINPIPNQLGIQQPWLPGSDYYINFRQGDPYSAVPEGLSRLPGTGYRRYNELHPDETGEYGIIDKHKILGDIAPWSQEYREVDRMVERYIQGPGDRDLVNQTRAQVGEKKKEVDFKPYEYSDTNYETKQARVIGLNRFGQLLTDQFDNPIALAGAIPNGSPESREVLEGLVGKDISVTTDANRPALMTDMDEPIQALIRANGRNINRRMLADDLADESDRGRGLLNADEDPFRRRLKSIAEGIAHRDTYFNTKFLPHKTAAEDWERRNVYGASFPQWQNPIKDYLMPSIHKATNRGPLLSGLALGAVGSLFGATPHAKIVGSLIGGVVGALAGLVRGGEEALAGDRFIPKRRKQEVAVEEYVDILSYVRNMRLRSQAMAVGDSILAAEYTKQAQRTMYGADVMADPSELKQALPERKRQHFMEMIHAPLNERSRILSTAGRLERRLYEAAWGMDVEARPDLGEYFSDRELPSETWEGWNPDVNMDHVKIKVAQNIGLDVSQMGYYPQQVAAANAVNPAYPDITDTSASRRSAEAELRKLMYDQGINGNVRRIPTPYPGTRVQMSAGVA